MNWICFGSSGHYCEPTGLVIENYTLRFFGTTQVNSHVKSIINPRLWTRWRNPHFPNMNGKIVYSDYSPCQHATGGKIDHTKCADTSLPN